MIPSPHDWKRRARQDRDLTKIISLVFPHQCNRSGSTSEGEQRYCFSLPLQSPHQCPSQMNTLPVSCYTSQKGNYVCVWWKEEAKLEKENAKDEKAGNREPPSLFVSATFSCESQASFKPLLLVTFKTNGSRVCVCVLLWSSPEYFYWFRISLFLRTKLCLHWSRFESQTSLFLPAFIWEGGFD